MAADLPALDLAKFTAQIECLAPTILDSVCLRRLFAHYQELRRWNRRMSLVGPGSAQQVLDRHYGEALAALPLVEPTDRVLLDIGSGAGFPGWVLAASAPGLDATLVEARERKWAFLKAVSRRAALPCSCLNARVSLPLPSGLPEPIDLVTVRALKLSPEVLAALAARLRSTGRLLAWVGEEAPRVPANLTAGESLPLPGSARRRILVLRPTESTTGSTGTDGK